MKTGRMFPVLMWILAMAMWGCPPSKKETPTPIPMPTPTSSAKGTLSFEDEAVTWVTTENYFAKAVRNSVPKWFGVLFQFGGFTDNPDFRGEVEFLGPAGNALTTAPLNAQGKLGEDAFTWINIVSDRGPAEAPVLPGEAWVLLPNGHYHPCDMGTSSNNCLRDRRIHCDQAHINFVITFWQGDHGYEVESAPVPGHPDMNAVEFKFPDDFAVEVYKMGDMGDMTEVMHFDKGAVGTINVHNAVEGTGPHGGKHDPTWEITTPP